MNPLAPLLGLTTPAVGAAPEVPTYRDARVVAVDPIGIRLAGDVDEYGNPVDVAIPPRTYCRVGVGDKVRVRHYENAYEIVGVIGGPRGAYAEDGDVETYTGTVASGASTGLVAVEFHAPFTVPPLVTATASNGRLTAAVHPDQVTETGFSYTLDNWSPAGAAGPTYVTWTAKQMTPTTAHG